MGLTRYGMGLFGSDTYASNELSGLVGFGGSKESFPPSWKYSFRAVTSRFGGQLSYVRHSLAPVSNVVEVHDVVAAKRLAASMHRSQFGENSMMARIPEDMRAQFYGEERFFQARPALGESVRTIRGIEELLPGDFS